MRLCPVGKDEVAVEDSGGASECVVISNRQGQVNLQSLKPDLPTFVNRKKTEEGPLNEGDRVRIGKSQMMLVAVTRFSSLLTAKTASTRPSQPVAEAPAGTFREPARSPAASEAEIRSDTTEQPRDFRSAIVGSLSEVSLPDLIQFLNLQGKDGVLNLIAKGDSGAIHFQSGQVCHASIAINPAPTARRAFVRLLRWKAGTFSFNPPPDQPVPCEISEPLGSLIMDAVSENEALLQLEADLPLPEEKLTVARLQAGELNKLAPSEMFVLGLVRVHKQVRAIVDNHPESDLKAYNLLAQLINRNIVLRG